VDRESLDHTDKALMKNSRDQLIEIYQFQIKDAVKVVRIEATKAYNQYAKEPKTSQRRGRFDLELEIAIILSFMDRAFERITA
jgi:hypothetical protein